MEVWKRNLWILWTGCFLSSVGINMIIPFLPLFVQELGVQDVNKAALWAAVIFSANHVMIAITSPLWGRLSDRYGQKVMMIRSGFGMGVIILLMGLVQSPMQLLILRAVFGTVAGFMTAATAFMAIDTPKEHVGRALGTLQTGSVSGQLLGPLLGGLLAEGLGMRNAFYMTGIFLLISTLLVVFGVKEAKTYARIPWFRRHAGAETYAAAAKAERPQAAKTGLREVLRYSPVLLTLFISTFLIAASMQSINPIITLYVKTMNVKEHVEIMGGLIFAASALGTMLAAPVLGKLGDSSGHAKILLTCLLLLAAINVPQAWIRDPWLLLGVRFLTGLCIGGLIPSVSSLLRNLTPSGIQGRVFGYNTSANSIGNVTGALFGGVVAGHLGIPFIFYCISVIFLVHAVLMMVQYKKVNQASNETSQ